MVTAASVVPTGAIADAVTSMTDPVETCLKTGEAAAVEAVTAAVVTVLVVIAGIVIEESASAALHPRAEKSPLLT